MIRHIWTHELRLFFRVPALGVALTIWTLGSAIGLAIASWIVTAFQPIASLHGALFQLHIGALLVFAMAVGGGIGAHSLTGEHRARTWELLCLTPAPRATLLFGKWLASTTKVAVWIAFQLPLTAIVVRMHGATLGEVPLAYGIVGAAAGFACAFGMATAAILGHAGAPASGGATLVSGIASTALALVILGYAGFAASTAVHAGWPEVPSTTPIWLPRAWLASPFGTGYVLYFVAIPAAAFVIPTWGLLEVAIYALSLKGQDDARRIERCWTTSLGVGGALSLGIIALSQLAIRQQIAFETLSVMLATSLILAAMVSDQVRSRVGGGACACACDSPRAQSPLRVWLRFAIAGTIFTVAAVPFVAQNASTLSSATAGAFFENGARALAPVVTAQVWIAFAFAVTTAVVLARKRGVSTPAVVRGGLLGVLAILYGPILLATQVGGSRSPPASLWWLELLSPLFPLRIGLVESPISQKIAAILLFFVTGGWLTLGVFALRSSFPKSSQHPRDVHRSSTNPLSLETDPTPTRRSDTAD